MSTDVSCLLACSPWLDQCASYTTQDNLPKGGTTHHGLESLAAIIIQENTPIDLPTGQLDGGICSVELPLSREI